MELEEHADPTAEAHAHLSNLLRTLVTAAAGTAEKRAQHRAQQMEEARRRSEEERRRLMARIESERQVAELTYRRVYDDSFWERADPRDIAEAVQAAGAWAATDPRAAHAFNRIARQLDDRYGFDLHHHYHEANDPNAVAGAVHDRVTDANQPTASRTGQQSALNRDRAGTPTAAGKPKARWETEILAAAGAELGQQLLKSEGWPHLQSRLNQLDGAGEDIPNRLARAIAERELDTALDKAVTLTWRLKAAASGTAASAGQDTSHAARQAAKGSPGAEANHRAQSTTNRQRFSDKQNIDQRHEDLGHQGPAAEAG
jgi:hypothetical protein